MRASRGRHACTPLKMRPLLSTGADNPKTYKSTPRMGAFRDMMLVRIVNNCLYSFFFSLFHGENLHLLPMWPLVVQVSLFLCSHEQFSWQKCFCGFGNQTTLPLFCGIPHTGTVLFVQHALAIQLSACLDSLSEVIVNGTKFQRSSGFYRRLFAQQSNV